MRLTARHSAVALVLERVSLQNDSNAWRVGEEAAATQRQSKESSSAAIVRLHKRAIRDQSAAAMRQWAAVLCSRSSLCDRSERQSSLLHRRSRWVTGGIIAMELSPHQRQHARSPRSLSVRACGCVLVPACRRVTVCAVVAIVCALRGEGSLPSYRALHRTQASDFGGKVEAMGESELRASACGVTDASLIVIAVRQRDSSHKNKLHDVYVLDNAGRATCTLFTSRQDSL